MNKPIHMAEEFSDIERMAHNQGRMEGDKSPVKYPSSGRISGRTPAQQQIDKTKEVLKGRIV